MYAHGDGGKKDYVKAREFQSLACEGGNAFGCINLGYLTEEGKGAEKDPAGAQVFFEKACTLGLPEACQKVIRPVQP